MAGRRKTFRNRKVGGSEAGEILQSATLEIKLNSYQLSQL
jgi:hypothetical protein